MYGSFDKKLTNVIFYHQIPWWSSLSNEELFPPTTITTTTAAQTRWIWRTGSNWFWTKSNWFWSGIRWDDNRQQRHQLQLEYQGRNFNNTSLGPLINCVTLTWIIFDPSLPLITLVPWSNTTVDLLVLPFALCELWTAPKTSFIIDVSCPLFRLANLLLEGNNISYLLQTCLKLPYQTYFGGLIDKGPIDKGPIK